MVFLLLQDRRLPPPSFFPSPHGATREWPAATEASLKFQERLPRKSGQHKIDIIVLCYWTTTEYKVLRKFLITQTFLQIAHFERKTDNHTSIILSETTYPAWSRLFYSLGPISLAALFLSDRGEPFHWRNIEIRRKLFPEGCAFFNVGEYV